MLWQVSPVAIAPLAAVATVSAGSNSVEVTAATEVIAEVEAEAVLAVVSSSSSSK
jgi:hypothetical protein